MKTLRFLFLSVTLLLSVVLFHACSNDEHTDLITLADQENTTLNLIYPSEKKYSYVIQGGDGNYSVKSGNNQVVTSEMVSSTELNIGIIGIGKTTITITDSSHNTLVLDVNVDYLTQKFIISKHDITIVGEDLTENEKKAIREKYLSEIPVKIGGGYQFIYTDAPNPCRAIVYTDTYGSKGTETTFIKKELETAEGIKTMAYEVTINSEKRDFSIRQYIPLNKSGVMSTFAFMEDITQKVQKEYSKAEQVVTAQVISSTSY